MRVEQLNPTTGTDCVVPDPNQRFTDRVEDYVRLRPAYPLGVVHGGVVQCLHSTKLHCGPIT